MRPHAWLDRGLRWTLREKLAGWSLAMPARIERVHRAADDTRKFLVAFAERPELGTVESQCIRKTRGDGVDAACGQLALRGAAPKKGRLRVVGAGASE